MPESCLPLPTLGCILLLASQRVKKMFRTGQLANVKRTLKPAVTKTALLSVVSDLG